MLKLNYEKLGKAVILITIMLITYLIIDFASKGLFGNKERETRYEKCKTMCEEKQLIMYDYQVKCITEGKNKVCQTNCICVPEIGWIEK